MSFEFYNLDKKHAFWSIKSETFQFILDSGVLTNIRTISGVFKDFLDSGKLFFMLLYDLGLI